MEVNKLDASHPFERFSQTLRRKQKIITRHVKRHLQTIRILFLNVNVTNARSKCACKADLHSLQMISPRCARRKQQAVPCQTENAAAQKYFSQLIGNSLNVKVDWIEKNIQSLMGKIFTHDEARNNFPATFGFSNIEEIFLFPCFTSRISLWVFQWAHICCLNASSARQRRERLNVVKR